LDWMSRLFLIVQESCLATKFFWRFFSPLSEILEKNKRLKYIEVHPGISEKSFISYLRLVYTNYDKFTIGDKSDLAENFRSCYFL